MPESPSFAEMLSGLQKGEQEAAAEVVERFAGRLLALAQTHLDSQIRQKVGPEDVVQSVFSSFFARFRDGKFVLKNWQSLWGLLVIITVRKCLRQRRRFHGPVSDVKRETPVEFSDWQLLDREPLPDEVAVLTETLEELFEQLNEREQNVLRLRLEGHRVREIAELLQRTEYSIEGILKRVRKKLAGMNDRIEWL